MGLWWHCSNGTRQKWASKTPVLALRVRHMSVLIAAKNRISRKTCGNRKINKNVAKNRKRHFFCGKLEMDPLLPTLSILFIHWSKGNKNFKTFRVNFRTFPIFTGQSPYTWYRTVGAQSRTLLVYEGNFCVMLSTWLLGEIFSFHIKQLCTLLALLEAEFG